MHFFIQVKYGELNMILYVTKKTRERLNIPIISELSDINKTFASIVYKKEKDNLLLEWGIKIFYMDRRKCLQAMNFASRFTIYIFDIHNDDIQYIGDVIAKYLLELYKDDKIMVEYLKRLFEKHSVCIYSNLTNKSIISALNYNETINVDYCDLFHEYIDNNVLKTIDINKDVNWNNIMNIYINGKKEYVVPGKYFKELLIDFYKGVNQNE